MADDPAHETPESLSGLGLALRALQIAARRARQLEAASKQSLADLKAEAARLEEKLLELAEDEQGPTQQELDRHLDLAEMREEEVGRARKEVSDIERAIEAVTAALLSTDYDHESGDPLPIWTLTETVDNIRRWAGIIQMVLGALLLGGAIWYTVSALGVVEAAVFQEPLGDGEKSQKIADQHVAAFLWARAIATASAFAIASGLLYGGARLLRPLWLEYKTMEINPKGATRAEKDKDGVIAGLIKQLIDALSGGGG